MRRSMKMVLALALAGGVSALGCGDSKTLPPADAGAGGKPAAGGASGKAGAAGGASGASGGASGAAGGASGAAGGRAGSAGVGGA